MNKNTLQKLFLFCCTLLTTGILSAQGLVFTSPLPDANITVECDAIPPAETLTAEGCNAIAPFRFYK